MKRTPAAIRTATFAACFAGALTLHAQGILQVTPGRVTGTVAGQTATLGYSGDSGAATDATLAHPGAVAYDAGGLRDLADDVVVGV
ncbi:hypothetical protein, partial [Silvibacterium sp.]|uniref:hypothetical protein n=1 Tax=Silvibacterium sp. TaxID=1964179 RepID=UPI0039E5EB46